MMETWIEDLVAFVKCNRSREYGTKEINEFKVARDGKISIQKDCRWDELLQLSCVFSGN